MVGYHQSIFQSFGSHGSALTAVSFNQASKQDLEAPVDCIYTNLGGDLDYSTASTIGPSLLAARCWQPSSHFRCRQEQEGQSPLRYPPNSSHPFSLPQSRFFRTRWALLGVQDFSGDPVPAWGFRKLNICAWLVPSFGAFTFEQSRFYY